MSSLYKKIEELCKNQNISVTDMCKLSGASRGSLSDIKMGRRKTLSTATIQKIAEYFNVSLDYLLGKDELRSAKPMYALDVEYMIHKLIKDHNISNEKFCSDLGISLSSVSDWKSGLSFSYLDYLDEIAEYFNVSLIDLLGEGYMKRYSTTDECIEQLKKSVQETIQNQPFKNTTPISENEIKFALFNGSSDITDEMFEEVKNFAKYVQQREKEKNGHK